MLKKILHRGIYVISVFSIGALLTPASVREIGICGVICVICSFLICIRSGKSELRIRPHRNLLILDLVTDVILAFDFYLRWMPSSKIAAAANILGVSVRRFVTVSAVLLGLLSFWIIDAVYSSISLNIAKGLERSSSRFRENSLKALLILLTVFLQYFSLEYSSLETVSEIVFKRPVILAANISILGFINLFFLFFLQRWYFVLPFTGTIAAVWSIANYYTIQFHGSPLFFSEFANIRTAAAVAADYNYRFTAVIAAILLILAEEYRIVIRNKEMMGKQAGFRERFLSRTGMLIFFGVLSGFLLNEYVIPKNSWSWESAVDLFGFLPQSVRDLAHRLDPVTEPEGYDVSLIQRTHQQGTEVKTEENKQYPDFILILNETFCDLDYFTELRPDCGYLDAFYSVPDAVFGHAVTPSIGGGTNNSEFELLTSKSMFLLKSGAPFTYLSPYQLERNIVPYLKSLSYITAGMHCGTSSSYSRDKAYPAMGFDHVIIGGNHFSYYSKNGGRSWLDSDNYRDLIDRYDENSDAPQFFYLLTYQNHGGYEQNADALDTVHTANDFGNLTDDINEYLSSVKLSGEAFLELTEYFKDSQRHVMICMVGDHAPSFINSLPARKDAPIQSDSINMRIVPYVMWSNFGADFSTGSDYAAMTDLVPIMLKGAGIPLSAFYSEIIDIHKEFPVRTSDGLYTDLSNTVSKYDRENEECSPLNLYYYSEYNSFLEDDRYINVFFEP